MNIFEAIRKDHEKQRTLLDILVKTEGDSLGRREIFDRLKRELETHAAAEERHFYVPLIDADLTQEKSRHGVAEHHEIDEMIAHLDQTDFTSPGWLPGAKKLKDLVEHHLDEEEHEIFQLAGKVLSEDRKRVLGMEYQQTLTEMKEEYRQ